jgi:hypothetical protein
MRRLRRRAAAALVFLAAGILIAPHPAEASPQCKYSTCQGKTPDAEGCLADADTIGYVSLPNEAHVQTRVPELDLFYSAGCEAAWFEFDTSDDTSQQQIHLDTIPAYGGVATTRFDTGLVTAPGSGASFVSTMVSWGQSMQACVALTFDTSTNPCTGWH